MRPTRRLGHIRHDRRQESRPAKRSTILQIPEITLDTVRTHQVLVLQVLVDKPTPATTGQRQMADRSIALMATERPGRNPIRIGGPGTRVAPGIKAVRDIKAALDQELAVLQGHTQKATCILRGSRHLGNLRIPRRQRIRWRVAGSLRCSTVPTTRTHTKNADAGTKILWQFIWPRERF